MDRIHRFADPDYADLTLKMRTGTDPGGVFDALHAGGHLVLHASDVERTATLAEHAATNGQELVIADTREQVAVLNAAIRDHRHSGEHEDDGAVTTGRGEQIGIGDRIATRRNDPILGVSNRQTWTVTGIGDDGSLVVHPTGQGPGVTTRSPRTTPTSTSSSPSPPQPMEPKARPSTMSTSPSVSPPGPRRPTSP